MCCRCSQVSRVEFLKGIYLSFTLFRTSTLNMALYIFIKYFQCYHYVSKVDYFVSKSMTSKNSKYKITIILFRYKFLKRGTLLIYFLFKWKNIGDFGDGDGRRFDYYSEECVIFFLHCGNMTMRSVTFCHSICSASKIRRRLGNRAT